jgi:hypothetical protein
MPGESTAPRLCHYSAGRPSVAVASSLTTPNSGNIGRWGLQLMRLHLALQHDVAEPAVLYGVEHKNRSMSESMTGGSLAGEGARWSAGTALLVALIAAILARVCRVIACGRLQDHLNSLAKRISYENL